VTKDSSKTTPPERVPTGISGLDLLWRGGLHRGGIYMVVGRPGAGKTILANQTCFNHVASGGRVLYVTLLTESHSRMLSHLKTFDFFDPKHVGASLKYFSGYQALENERLTGLLAFLRRLVRDHKATLLIIDGLVTAGDIAQTQLELKKFIHELQSLTELVRCTAMLLTGADGSADQYAVRTMVDGLIELSLGPIGMAIARTIEVVKSRGGPVITGRHRFAIADSGITVYPRLEATVGRAPSSRVAGRSPLSLGIKSLDRMVGGGVRPASVTMLLGSSGTGKTLLGLSFLAAGVGEQEPGLYLGFSETPANLLRNAEGLGPELSRRLRNKLVELSWQPPSDDLIPDAMAEEVIGLVRNKGIRRLFIDGIGGFTDAMLGRERTGKFFAAFGNELRTLGVATIFSEQTPDLFAPKIELPLHELAATMDNIIVLRHVELRARLHRLISVMKMRGDGTDSSLREFSITERGIEISPTFDSAEAILSGIARTRLDPSDAPRTEGHSPVGRRNQPR